MHAQGGEKKVMKKILSVALSTAMAFSMFASVAFGDTAKLSTQEKFDALKVKGIFSGDTDGLAHLERDMTRAEFAKVITKVMGLKEVTGVYSYNDTGYNNPKNWAAPYIEAVSAAGVMQGKDLTKKLFDQKANVTVQELAEVLVKALKLEIPTKIDNTATEWAKGSVQAAINAGLISKDLNFQANANRSLLVEAAFAAEAALNVPPVTTATKVASVSATNLKEVVVAYDGTVDKATAENKDAYTIKRGLSTEVIDSAELQADGKTVVLSVAGALANQSKEYTLSVDGVKDSASKVSVSAKELAFVPLDQLLPTVESVTNLGNKAVKVTFSEPVTLNGSVASTFKIDDKVVSGTYDVTGRTVTIALFNTLTDGDHNLTVNNNIRDFANYQLVEVSKAFSVVADTVAPTVVESKDATLEGVTLVFSEDVKKAEVENAENYVWFSGTSKKVASSAKQINSKTVRVSFAANKLPGYAVDLVVNNIVDYSGNKIAADTKVSVTAKLDQVRPEVLSSKFDSDARTLTVNFSKTVDKATFKAANLIVKDKDGKVVSNGYTAAYGSNDSKLVITFTKTLAAGNYAVELSGVTDVTLLANAMLPYTTSLTVVNGAAPTALSITGTGTTYVVAFDKKMDQSSTYSVLNPDNYFITYRTTDGKTISGKLPAATNLAPTNDGKGVIVQLPTGILSISSFTVQGVKDAEGNFLADYSKTFNLAAIGSTVNLVSAKTVAKDKVELTLNQPIGNVNKADFRVNGSTVKNATISSSNNNVIVLTLNSAITSNATPTVTTAATLATVNPTQGVTGAGLLVNASTGVVSKDGVAPVVISSGDKVTIGSGAGVHFDGNDLITITYDEAITELNEVTLQDNVIITRADGIALKKGQDFFAEVVSGKIEIELKTTGKNLVDFDGLFTVAIDNANENIVDANDNVAASFTTADATSNQDTLDFQLDPTVTLETSTASSLVLKLSETATVAVTGGTATGLTVVTPETAATSVTISGTAATTGQTVEFTVTDAVGNVTTKTATFTTVWTLS